MDDEKGRVYESILGSNFESIENGLISLIPLRIGSNGGRCH